MQFNEGSFRDPSGQVFIENGRVFRTINSVAAERYADLKNSGLLETIIRDGWMVDTWEVEAHQFDLPENVSYVVEHEKLPLITYPYEWTPAQLKSAALLHLDFQLYLLESDWTLSDATAYNVQFNLKTGKPIFIDLLSLKPYADGEYWLGQNQFCEQFLNPLLLSYNLGVNYNDIYSGNMKGVSNIVIESILGFRKYLSPTVLMNVVIPAKLQKKSIASKGKPNSKIKGVTKKPLPKSAYISIIRNLRKFISKLETNRLSTSVWADYSKDNTYTIDNELNKKEFISEFCSTIKPTILWDIGCNSGVYSEVALNSGAKQVVGLDSDVTALNTAFVRMAEQNRPFVSVYFDAANPSPNQGWMLKERQSVMARANPDAIMALAVIHHLVIGNNIPIESCIHWFLSIADKGVIEFVGKKDETVLEMLAFREDIFPDYNYKHFKSCLLKKVRVTRELSLPGTDRVLVWYEKN